MSSPDQTKPCAICGKPQMASLRPFCSRRCADVDLHRWLLGAYVVPASEGDNRESGLPGGEEPAP